MLVESTERPDRTGCHLPRYKLLFITTASFIIININVSDCHLGGQ